MAEEQRIRFWYVNWKGVGSWRVVTPISVRFGTSEWHKKPQWLLLALDDDKKEEREFAMKNISRWDEGYTGQGVLD